MICGAYNQVYGLVHITNYRLICIISLIQHTVKSDLFCIWPIFNRILTYFFVLAYQFYRLATTKSNLAQHLPFSMGFYLFIVFEHVFYRMHKIFSFRSTTLMLRTNLFGFYS